jgi:hypothetical protein
MRKLSAEGALGGALLLATTAALFGSNFVAVKVALRSTDPFTLGAIQAVSAVIVIGAVALRMGGSLALTFLDAGLGTTDSDEALQAVLSAGEQDKLRNVLELLYRNQGAEGSGWVTDDVVRRVGDTVDGLDVERFLTAREGELVTTTIREMAARADVSGVGAPRRAKPA